jgi:hypothetical protein
MSTSTQQLNSAVGFVGIPTHDLARAVVFCGETLGLRRSVYMPERDFAEFETANLALNILDAQERLEHVAFRNPLTLQVAGVAAGRAALESRGVTFAGTRSTPASAIWRSSPFRTLTR